MAHYIITKRTFLAKEYAVGSKERKKLNEKAETSEYMPSHKWSLIGKNISITFKTLKEARFWIERK